MQRRTTLLALGAACLALAAACGSPTSGGGGAPAAGTGGASQAEQVYSEVGGLTGDARRDRLVELAKQEGNTPLALHLVERRHRRRRRAGVQGAVRHRRQDLPGGLRDGPAAHPAGELGLLRRRRRRRDQRHRDGRARRQGPDRRLPQRESATRSTRSSSTEGWTPTRFNIFAPAWNTQQVSGDLIPTDVGGPRRPEVRRACCPLEVGDSDWYMTLYGYLQEQGKSDAEIDQLFADMVNGAKVAKGHSGQVELLSAGEFGVVGASYSYLTAKARERRGPGRRPALRQPGRRPRQRRRRAEVGRAPGHRDAVHGLVARGRASS